jgi:hypothetical protein
MVSSYFWNLLISIDQLFNTIGGGDPDETISSRAGKVEHKNTFAKYLCKFLGLFDKDHCSKSIELDEGIK